MTYREWNRALGKWIFRAERSGRYVHLAVDAEELLRAARNDGHDFSSAVEARADFVGAIRTELGYRDWPNSGELWEGYPRCIGLLAFQVLAVTDMADDKTWTSKAYWPRVNELLGRATRPGGNSGIPKALGYETHADLWRKHLAGWAKFTKKGELGLLFLPPFDEGHKYIRIPISHALLRRADLDRLGPLFQESGFHAYERDVSLTRIQVILKYHSGSTQVLGPHARRVVNDQDRLEAAARQVAAVLAEWDGTTTLRARTTEKRPEVRLWADLLGRGDTKLVGGVLFRAPIGSNKTEWKRSTRAELKSVLARPASKIDWSEGSYTLSYRPISANPIVLALDSSTNYYIERRRGGVGDDVLILCQGDIATRLCQGIDAVSESRSVLIYGAACNAESLDGLPKGWGLIRLRVSRSLGSSLPSPWDQVLEPNLASLRLVGGLRLVPHRPVWLAGAAPAVHVDKSTSKFLVVRHDAQMSQAPLDKGVTPPGKFELEGHYEVWLPGEEWRALRFSVRHPRRLGLVDTHQGWLLQNGTWPKANPQPKEGELPFVCGMSAYGPFLEVDEVEGSNKQTTAIPDTRLFLELSLRFQGHFIPIPGFLDEYVEAGKAHPNPLIRHLAQLVGMRQTNHCVRNAR